MFGCVFRAAWSCGLTSSGAVGDASNYSAGCQWVNELHSITCRCTFLAACVMPTQCAHICAPASCLTPCFLWCCDERTCEASSHPDPDRFVRAALQHTFPPAFSHFYAERESAAARAAVDKASTEAGAQVSISTTLSVEHVRRRDKHVRDWHAFLKQNIWGDDGTAQDGDAAASLHDLDMSELRLGMRDTVSRGAGTGTGAGRRDECIVADVHVDRCGEQPHRMQTKLQTPTPPGFSASKTSATPTVVAKKKRKKKKGKKMSKQERMRPRSCPICKDSAMYQGIRALYNHCAREHRPLVSCM